MSYIGATGLTEYEERFATIEEEIDSNANYINTLVGIPDPIHLGLYGINIYNPSLYGLVERAEVNISSLQATEDGLSTDLSALTSQVEGIETSVGALETSVGALETSVSGIQTQILGIDGDISTLNGAVFLEGGAIALVELQAADALTKANRALDIWDYSGDNVYHKKSGNVGIGTTFGSVLNNNKLEVNGNINIPTGSKYKINNVNLEFSDLGTLSYNSLSDKPTLFDGNYNSLTNKLTGGTNIQILNGVINNLYSYTLPTATTAVIGGVRPDGTTILINNGVISSTGGTAQVNSDWTQTNTSLKSFIQNKPTAGTNISLANNTITNTITGSPTQNIIDLNNNYLIVKDKPDSQIVSQVDVPLTSVNEPTITSPTFTESIRTFTHSGGTEEQTTHTITIGQNTICDILVIGGGGAGGNSIGGGGGAGGVVYTINQTLIAGTYTIGVGKGGIGTIHPGGDGQGTVGVDQDGKDSFVQLNSTDVSLSMGGISQSLRGKGGGGGGVYYSAITGNGRNGGSGGGAAEREIAIYNGGSSTQGNTLWNGTSYVAGGSAGNGNLTSDGHYYAAGGGGAGNTLFNNSIYNGKTGVQINITGVSQFYAAGGGGGQLVSNDLTRGLGGSGIGGNGRVWTGSQYIREASKGTDRTGSGGGGGSYGDDPDLPAGNGGSGIVIIKFRTIVNAGIPEGNPITHKTLNFAYVSPLIYDFTPYNDLNSWKNYATSIGATTTNLQIFSFNGVYGDGTAVGSIQLPLPSGYNQVKVNYNTPWSSPIYLYIDNVLKDTCPANSSREYIQSYTTGQVLKIEEQISVIGENLIITLTSTPPNTYTLSVQSGTSIQVNNGTAQYLSGNYTISVGATQSSVVKSGIGQVGSDPYPLQNGSTIAIRYSMLQRITSTINIKKDGLIKYVPASGTNPTTGSWNIIDIDTQPLTQFSGNLDWSRISSQPALSALSGNLDWSRIASQPVLSSLSGNLDWSRIASQPALSALSGNLNWSRIDSKPALADLSGSLLWSRIDQSSFYIPSDRWIQDNHAYNRFFLAYNGTTYIQGYQTQPIEFRNGVSTPIAWFNDTGEFTCMFETQSSTNSDHVIIRGNTGLTSRNRYRLLLGHETFTGFHRCYTDDELYNEDSVDIFKNNYKGRIVISTGKIKTDSSRDIPNTDGETKSEWYSAIDKDGIMIEDAIPIVQLSRVKKDKRVYGVFGSPTRSTNNKNRLIVNSVGEGAICVCNTNGNIENGDYIQSSELLGFGEKQDDDILHNYSVAKAVMNCTFQLDSPYYQCYELEGGVRVAFIACTYHCG
jgi:hypothetical protein